MSSESKDKAQDQEENRAGEDVEAAAQGESAGADEAENLESRLEEALAETEKFKDMALRAEAEMQNVRRRAERDVENAHKYGLEKFIQNLLPVVDSLEKAIEAAEEAVADGGAGGKDEAILEGVRLCHKMLLDVLSRENAEVVNPEGEPFDPNEHEAMSIVENSDVEPNSVVAVVQKGYKLNGRLVRPAMVMVSKAPPAADKGGRE